MAYKTATGGLMIQFTEITDFQAPELDVYARLTEAQLLNRFEPVSLLVERSHCNEEAREAIERCGDVPVYTAGMEVLTQLTGFRLTRGSVDPLYRRSARVSMGTVFQVPWTFLEENWMDTLRGAGFRTAAMALTEDSLPITHPALRQEERLAVVLGTEGDGLACSTIAACDYTVKIPMYHGVDSLNVAAASAVAFWELRAR